MAPVGDLKKSKRNKQFLEFNLMGGLFHAKNLKSTIFKGSQFWGPLTPQVALDQKVAYHKMLLELDCSGEEIHFM